MASDVVSPFSARAIAALAFARIVLFTLGKLLSILVLRAVYDMCSVEDLIHLFHLFSAFFFDTLLPSLSLFLIQLVHILLAINNAYTPSFLHVDIFYLASEIWKALEPCIPPPPVQYCVLGKGIGCGARLARRSLTDAISDLGTRLVQNLIDRGWSLGLSLVETSCAVLSHQLFQYGLLSVMVVFGFISLWMLYSLDSDRPLEADELRSILSIHTTLDLVLQVACRSLAAHSCWPEP